MIVSINKIFDKYDPSIFGEYLFAYKENIKTLISFTAYNIVFDIVLNDSVVQKNVTMFSEEWVGIHYWAVLNNVLLNLVYINMKIKTFIANNGNPYSTANYIRIPNSDDIWNNVDYKLNKHTMKLFQGDDGLSFKLINSDHTKALTETNNEANNNGIYTRLKTSENVIRYKKYLNIYNYIELYNNKLYVPDDILEVIKSNIILGDFTNVELFKDSTIEEYTTSTIVLAENGLYNKADEDIYIIYSSNPEDATSLEANKLSYALKLKCKNDNTSYEVLEMFSLPILFADDANSDIIKIDNDKLYITSVNLNCILDFNTHKMLYQRYIDDSTTLECYKYAPIYISPNEYKLYELPNYYDTLGIDKNGFKTILFDYNIASNFTNPNNEGHLPSILNKIALSTDIFFNNIKSEIYLQLNEDVWLHNIKNIDLIDPVQSSSVMLPNGTMFNLYDEYSTVRIKNIFTFYNHTIFHKNVSAILNINFEFDNTTGEYTPYLNSDVYGDFYNIKNLVNSNDISKLNFDNRYNEIAFILLEKKDSNEYSNYPTYIVVSSNMEEVSTEDNVVYIPIMKYPERLININNSNVLKYYKFKLFIRFRKDYMNDVLNVIKLY